MLKGRGTNVLYWKNGVVQGRLCWGYLDKTGKRKTLTTCFKLLASFCKWCHQKTSFFSKWLYIFALKNRNKRNLPLLLHLISAPFCSVSQSRVPTLMQSYCFILKYKRMHQNFAPPQFGIPNFQNIE